MSKAYEGAAFAAVAEFRDPATRALTDVQEPVTITARPPAGAEQQQTAVRVAPGRYRAVFIGTAGAWRLRAQSSGEEPAVAKGRITVYSADLSEG